MGPEFELEGVVMVVDVLGLDVTKTRPAQITKIMITSAATTAASLPMVSL
jgi:hypothetical protein